MELTRRDLIAGAATAGAVAVGAAATARASEAPQQDFELSIDWAAEYDVIVVGFGGAGANSAIAAADEGAKVLLLEKAPEVDAGGSSIVCWQLLCYTDKPEQMVTYMKAMRGGYETPSDELIETYVQGMTENLDWVKFLGVEDPVITPTAEWPEFEGSDAFSMITVHDAKGDGAAYQLFKDNVLERADNIDVWYEAPATKLIQDPQTRIVHGVVAQVDGQEINVRARGGVILCLGGFENSPRYQQDYLGVEFWPSLGAALYNTGDGIPMGQEAGADFWHMSNFEINPIEFVDPQTLDATWQFVAYLPGILIGGEGKRYISETEVRGRHGHVNWGGTYVAPPLPDITYEIVDQAMFEQGPLYVSWSPTGEQEIEKGWIIKADTLEELAQKIGVPADNLVQQIADYNAFCEAGRDLQCERNPETLTAFGDGPFYAVPLAHTTVNTQGGPVKDSEGQILAPDGTPIPHLYEAGEFGDIWSHCYQAACNLGGGMIFGRISGRNAAKAKDDNYQGSVMEGKENYVPQNSGLIAEDPAAPYRDQATDTVKIGWAMGKRAPIVVKVSMNGDVIGDVQILEQHETNVIAQWPLTCIPMAIVEANDPVVDVISGSTATSAAIMAAVMNALG